MVKIFVINILFIIPVMVGLSAFALRLDAVTLRATMPRQCLPRQMAVTSDPIHKNLDECSDEEWMEVLRSHRKGAAPRKVVEEVQQRVEKNTISESMLVKAFRTLERMNRNDLAMKIVYIWPKVASKRGVNFGSAFVLVNACCKQMDLQMACEICRITGLLIDKDLVDYAPEKLNKHQATDLLVELIVGYQTKNEYDEALSLLVRMQESERDWTISEDNTRRIMKQFFKGTGRSKMIRTALRSLVLMGGLKDKEGLQLVTNTYATSIRFVKGAVNMDTLPIVVNTEASVRSSEEKDSASIRGGVEYVEVAFIGRSNVGKSSLINMMTNRKGLAFTSKTPGKTAEFNYFELRSRYNDLVDAWNEKKNIEGHGHETKVSSSDTFGGKYNAKKNDWNNNGPSLRHGGQSPGNRRGIPLEEEENAWELWQAGYIKKRRQQH